MFPVSASPFGEPDSIITIQQLVTHLKTTKIETKLDPCACLLCEEGKPAYLQHSESGWYASPIFL